MPTLGPLSDQKIRDRYYGVNDPVAEKMLARVERLGRLTPPEDKTICTLFVGGVTREWLGLGGWAGWGERGAWRWPHACARACTHPSRPPDAPPAFSPPPNTTPPSQPTSQRTTCAIASTPMAS